MFIPPWAAPSRQFSQPATTISDPPPVFVRSPSSQSPHERSNRSVMQGDSPQFSGDFPITAIIHTFFEQKVLTQFVRMHNNNVPLPPFDQWPDRARKAQFSCKLLAVSF